MIKAGHYTDDTQMAIANAELLLTSKSAFSDDAFIESWLAAFRRDPRVGYSQHMYKVLSEAKDTADFRSKIDGRGTTSGGAMRAGVFGLLANVEQVKALTLQQARITHDTTAGCNAALAVALGVHFLHHGGRTHQFPYFIEHHLGAD